MEPVPDASGEVDLVRTAGVHRLGMEDTTVVPGTAEQLATRLPGADAPGRFAVSLDDQVLALADPHGRDLAWL